jgi:predicted nucleic acid-binding protein
MKINAVLDACVLYSATLRSLLLDLAADGELINPLWSEKIHDEWIGSLVENRPELKERLERTRQRMDFYFPHCLVREYEYLTPTLQLPDSKDEHVLAVAIHAKAEYIVTTNLKDFPNSVLQHYGIEALLPDEIILRIIQRKPTRVITVINKHRQGFINPPLSVAEYLVMLEKQKLFKTVSFLREHEDKL